MAAYFTIICPHCSKEQTRFRKLQGVLEPWEWDCSACGKSFIAEVKVEVRLAW